jgi:signal transduction histidine kinase
MQSFVWQPILILLPLGVLTGAGLYSLRQDRLLAEQDAREQGAAAAVRMAQTFGHELTRQLNDYREANTALLNSRMTGSGKSEAATLQRLKDWQQANPGVDLSAMPVSDCVLNVRGEFSSPQIYPLSPQPPDWLEKLSPEQRRLWHEEEKAEFVSNDPSAAQAVIKNFIAAKPPAGARANAELDLLLLKTRGLPAAEAAAQLAESAEANADQLTEAGLPVAQLICYRALQLLPDHAGVPENLFRGMAQAIQNRPSILSPSLIAEAERVAAPGTAKLKAWWDSEEKARVLMRDFLEQHPLGGWSNALYWAESSRGQFLLAPNYQISSTNCGLLIFPPAILDIAVTTADVSPPPYAMIGLEIGGKTLAVQGRHFLMASNEPSLPILGQAGGSFGVPQGTNVVPFRVRMFLADSQLLYARQHERTMLFGAMILASTCAALVGLAAAGRAFNRQRELNELKSNFVSSVSHELRAPIASMRLLAESLERGKIPGAAKQKEYFGLLVQESRRLSMLIENILDFSRIERGGKKYQFEPANIVALAEDTAQLMRPCAAERQVGLDVRKNGATGAESFACDGLALQQALINLIDNAVKHSPPAGRVTIGLDSGATGVSLWVEDNGAGIPAEEHERIFERFYRRGSELRRETQGIGIGLTIVKHIVEAHGGRVTVRSAPGQGSRFTMDLPKP